MAANNRQLRLAYVQEQKLIQEMNFAKTSSMH